MKEETPIMGEISPTRYAKVVCYVKLVGEFSPTTYAKVICYVKLVVEFSPTKYTVKDVKVTGEFSPAM